MIRLLIGLVLIFIGVGSFDVEGNPLWLSATLTMVGVAVFAWAMVNTRN